MLRLLRPLSVITLFILLSACQSLVANMTDSLASQLQRAVQASNDPPLVASALPAYMILIDGMLMDDPENPELLLSSANLYTAYAGIFVNDSDRQKKLALRGYQLASEGVCIEDERFCQLEKLPFDTMSKRLEMTETEDTWLMFSLARSWAGYIQSASDDWKAIAHLARVQALLERVVYLEPNFADGEAQYYLGVIKSLVPPALGGKPQLALQHFQQALVFSENKNLMIKVAIAERYARVIFDRQLHDRILREVLNDQTNSDRYRLTNTLAKQKARLLLDSADEFF